MTFQERLLKGQLREQEIQDILIDNGVDAVCNNDVNVKDIDLWLPKFEIYLECKYLNKSFGEAYERVGITARNAIVVNVYHVKRYLELELERGFPVWLAFLVNYEEHDVHKLVFFPNNYLVNELTFQPKHVFQGKLNVPWRNGLDLDEFLLFLQRKTIKEALNV